MICLGWLLLEKVFEKKKIMLYWDWTYASWLPLQCKPLVPLYVPFMEVLSGVGLPQHCFWPIHGSICIVFMEGPLCMNNYYLYLRQNVAARDPILAVHGNVYHYHLSVPSQFSQACQKSGGSNYAIVMERHLHPKQLLCWLGLFAFSKCVGHSSNAS